MAETTPSASSLIIGEGVTFTGTISAPGRATINGTVTGEITVNDLHIGIKGSVSGAIDAHTIDVHGTLIVAPKRGITLPSGLHIQYPGLRQVASESGKTGWVYDSKGEVIRIFGPKVVENVTQAVARCIIAEQMLRISKKYRVVLTVHDAIACVAPVEEAEEAVAYVEQCMRWRPDWCKDLPLNCEAGYGENYGQT